MISRNLLPLALFCCLLGGCGRSRPDAAVPKTQQAEPAPSEVKTEAVLPLKPLTELTNDEIQKELVGTWQVKSGVSTVIAFDAHGRVPFFGNGADAQVVDMDFLQGKVLYQIEKDGTVRKLKIVTPASKGDSGRLFEIKRLTRDELDLLELLKKGRAELITFKRVDREAPSIMGE